MKKAAGVLGCYLGVGVALYFASGQFPVDSALNQWLCFFSIVALSLPGVTIIGIAIIGPHEYGHIYFGQRFGFQFFGLRMLGFSLYGRSRNRRLEWNINAVSHVGRILVKKNPSLSEVRWMLLGGPIASLLMGVLWSPFLFFDLTSMFGTFAVGANLAYGFGALIPTAQHRNDGEFLLQSVRKPESLLRELSIHYDQTAEWLRPSGYPDEAILETGDATDICYSNMLMFWKHEDEGKFPEAEPYLRAALYKVRENPESDPKMVICCYEAALFYRRFMPNEELSAMADELCDSLDADNGRRQLVDAAKLWVLGDKAEANRIWSEYLVNYLKQYPDPGSVVHGRDWLLRLRREDMLFESERLFAKPWTMTDVEAIYEIYREPEVVRYLGATPKTIDTIEEATAVLERWSKIQSERPSGQGGWAIVRKEDERVIGTIMCKSLPNNDMEPSGEIEIGWHLGREYWGYGYATEAAKAVAEYGFKMNPDAPRFLAVVYSDNKASRKVAEKIGMKHLGVSNDYYGVPLELFELKRPQPQD